MVVTNLLDVDLPDKAKEEVEEDGEGEEDHEDGNAGEGYSDANVLMIFCV